MNTTVDYDKLKADILAALKEDWGPRCASTDIDDFPDTDYNDSKNTRCPVCLIYEKFDKFWEHLVPQ